MTTNQTIDGVSRELVEWAYCLSCSMGYRADPRTAQLLDKEVSGDSRAPQPQDEPVAWNVYWADNGEYYFTCHKKERSAKLIADPEFKVQALYAEHTVPVATKKNDR